MGEIRKDLIETVREQFLTESKSANDAIQTGTKGTLEFAKLALNSCFLLNAGAAMALLYNAKHLGDSWRIPLLLCAVGALASVLASGAAYLAQNHLTKHSAAQINAGLEFSSRFLVSLITGEVPKERSAPYIDSAPAKKWTRITCGLFLLSCACSSGALVSFLFVM